MHPSLSADAATYKAIMAWGNNTADAWYHPVTRAEFTGLGSLRAGDTIDFILDGVSQPVQVVNIGAIYNFPLMKQLYGEVNVPVKFDRYIYVRKV
jgi:hypothetical protein